jgi:DNA-binding LacI/PurR family transcriptional regulator
MPSKVTIATVARHANVSRQTVSNVLNAPDMVRDETRARVIAAIEKLGYRTNLAARQMRTGRSRLIGVRIDPVRNGIEAAVLDRFLHGLTETAAPAGYRIVLYTAADDDAEIATYDELLATYALDGFVLTQTHYHDARTAWLLAHDVPFTTFGRPWGAQQRHSWVDVDGAAGTAAATEHLITAGHRRIAFLGWPPGSGVGDDRRSGWATAMAAHGLDFDGLARHALDGIAEGERLARDLLAEPDPPSAFVCASDPLAIGAWRAGELRAGGLAAIGFDDTPMAQAAGLSSVRQPLAEVATECIRTLSLVLGDRAIAPAAGSRSADDSAAIPRQSRVGDVGGLDAGGLDVGGLAAAGLDTDGFGIAAGGNESSAGIADVAPADVSPIDAASTDESLPGTESSGTNRSATKRSSIQVRPIDGRSHNTTYGSGGATAPNDPAARRILLRPHLVVRDSG